MSNTQNLKNKNVWLIGASTGIGESLAHSLSLEVNNLFLSARSADKLHKVTENISRPNIFAEPCDISKLEDIQNTYSKIKDKVSKLDVIILNAAVYHPTDVLNFKLSEYLEQININYSGNVNVTSVVLDDFISNKSGHFVVISSQSAFRAMPKAGGYGASKAALTYFFESLRMQVEDLGINVSIIYPGFVKTRLTEKNNFNMPFIMEASEAAKLIVGVLKKGSGDLSFPIGLALPIQILRLFPERIYRKIMKTFFMGN